MEAWNSSRLELIAGSLILLQVAPDWKGRDHFCFGRAVRVAQADLASTVIAGLHDVVIALLVPAVTALGCHRATRFRPCVRMTNLGDSFLLCQFGRSLR
ncbi:MAG: hypothetical protein DMG61_11750 [Acidobacteria bacterium]|nr:MAG: hypothetical protein DMG61_11750 [Acidobacteriota bacterium]